MKRFAAIYALLGALLSLVLTPVANAQTATVGGRNVDQTEQIVSGAQITVLNPETNATRVDITDETRPFRFTGLVPGPYRLTIEKSDFKTLHIDDLVLTVNQVLLSKPTSRSAPLLRLKPPTSHSSNLKMPRSATWWIPNALRIFLC